MAGAAGASSVLLIGSAAAVVAASSLAVMVVLYAMGGADVLQKILDFLKNLPCRPHTAKIIRGEVLPCSYTQK